MFTNRIILLVFLLFLRISKFPILSQSVAETPPMGWSTWMVLRCYTHCTNSDQNPLCYSENSITEIAKAMDQKGYVRAGYQYLILDDCWQSSSRTWDLDMKQRLYADYKRFPNMASLVQYIHTLGMKVGIFSDLGPLTGQSFPGSYGFYETDADTFISWDVDYVKMSAASVKDPILLDYLYPRFGELLSTRSYKQILYAVSWPVYKTYEGYNVDYSLVQRNANTWRFSGDMQPSWRSILHIMDEYKNEQATLRKVAGKGGWNDPDVLLVGHPALTYDQSKAQMAVWCIMAAPLIISTDIRILGDEYRYILQNPIAIAINQDRLAKPGYMLRTEDEYIDVWIKKIEPYEYGQYSYAIAFVNRQLGGDPIPVTIPFSELGLDNEYGYYVKEVFLSDVRDRGPEMSRKDSFQIQVNPSGVLFYRAEAKQPKLSRSIVSTQPLPEIIVHRY